MVSFAPFIPFTSLSVLALRGIICAKGPCVNHFSTRYTDIYVASFFSIHRPMSVTTSVPSNSSPDAFSSIFSKTSSKSRQNNVVHTIASAAQSIEKAIQKKGGQSVQSSEESDLRAAVAQASSSNAESNVTHLDGVPTQDLRESIQEFAKRLRPFNPPPAPVPVDEANSVDPMQGEEYESDPAYASEGDKEQQSYSTVLTIRESTHSDGHKTYEAHTTPFVQVNELEAPTHFDGPIIEEPASERSANVPSRFLERMRIRQLRWDDFRERRNRGRTMHAISVKRIRKLKMKKHKYKKLMRKTRSLRRKLDKTWFLSCFLFFSSLPLLLFFLLQN